LKTGLNSWRGLTIKRKTAETEVSDENKKEFVSSRYTLFVSGFPYWSPDLRLEPLSDAYVGSRCLDKTAVLHNLCPLAFDLCSSPHVRFEFLERREGKP
jgi:hypothetical protein